MTEQIVVDDIDLAVARQIQLESIYLKSCNVQRQAVGTGFQAGGVSASISIKFEHDEDRLAYELTGEYEFLDDEGAELAAVVATFTANYTVPVESRLSDQLVNSFAQAVIFQTTPFQREFLATITNRMAIPPFYLPLVRDTDLGYREDDGSPPL